MATFYTDAATVAAALRMSPDTSLSLACAAGATALTVESNMTPDQTPLYVGMSLTLDQYNPTLRETVTVAGVVTGTGPYTVPVSATANAHVQGAPVKETSRLADVIGAASALVDAFCWQEAGAFASQAWTETMRGQVQDDGRLYCAVTGRIISAVTAYAWKTDNGDSGTVDPSLLIWDDYQLWALPLSEAGTGPTTAQLASTLPASPSLKNVLVTVSYTAGYATIPADIARSAAIVAARLYKENDAGFSDITGSATTGTFQYSKAVPKHVEVMLLPRRRWA